MSIFKRIKKFFTPTIASILATVAKVEAELEVAIVAAQDDLEAVNNLREALVKRAADANRDLDAAYKLLHNVSSIVR
jgi:hypothetical protein